MLENLQACFLLHFRTKKIPFRNLLTFRWYMFEENQDTELLDLFTVEYASHVLSILSKILFSSYTYANR